MQPLSTKKGSDEVFIKLGSDKDAQKKKENAERDERAKKVLHLSPLFRFIMFLISRYQGAEIPKSLFSIRV
uniref:Uncharacterized protein n=1 Tax=Arundo donax TaxID=35708 RepID=A0A0A9CZZ6_ARUDO